jgi:hypothetical protein
MKTKPYLSSDNKFPSFYPFYEFRQRPTDPGARQGKQADADDKPIGEPI